MLHILDERTEEFINAELSKISADKERVTEEKRRIEAEINKLNFGSENQTPEQVKRLDLLKNYADMLEKLNGLCFQGDIALFHMVARIGEMAREEVDGLISAHKEVYCDGTLNIE